MRQDDTIVAIATASGRGAVGIVRLSGPLAYTIALTLSHQSVLTPRYAYYSDFISTNGDVIDQGLIIFFKAPYSFTGEDVVEFQSHGSPIVMDLLIKQSLLLGARLANPGEFSLRAYLNNKMDLTQAEAIADLIEASSETAAKMAVRSLQGSFSKAIHALGEKIIRLRLYVEATIDFPDEEIDVMTKRHINISFEEIYLDLITLKKNVTQGSLMREGISLVIAGLPNAGKSTLINALSGREVAIVTDIAGTTRDVMKEYILLDDLPIHIIDTAGLRESDDIVEKEGIRRAWDEVKRADCILWIIDASNECDNDLTCQIKAELPVLIPIISVYNKIDVMLSTNAVNQENSVCISAKSGQGLEELKKLIKKTVGFQPAEGQFLARRRHLDALDKAQYYLDSGKKQLNLAGALELLADDLRYSHESLCDITGEFSADDLLGCIFSSFCIGK